MHDRKCVPGPCGMHPAADTAVRCSCLLPWGAVGSHCMAASCDISRRSPSGVWVLAKLPGCNVQQCCSLGGYFACHPAAELLPSSKWHNAAQDIATTLDQAARANVLTTAALHVQKLQDDLATMKRGSVPIQPTLEEPMSAGQVSGWDTSGAAQEAASTLDRAQGLMQLANSWIHWAPLGGYRRPAEEGRC